MKSKTMLLGVMIVAALLIMAQPSVSNAATYSGVWGANDQADAFFVQFSNPLLENPDSFYIYDWRNSSASLEVLFSQNWQTVYFTPDSGKWYVGLNSGDLTLDLGTDLEFGFYFKENPTSGSPTNHFSYELVVNNPNENYTLFRDISNIQVVTSDIHPVPISASALLLGSGMVGLIGFGKKRMKK